MWIPDPDAVWVSAALLQNYSPAEKHLRLQLSDGKVSVDVVSENHCQGTGVFTKKPALY